MPESPALTHFRHWFAFPPVTDKSSVISTLDSLNAMPWPPSDSCPVWFALPTRYRVRDRSILVFGEVQDLWTCFIADDRGDDDDVQVASGFQRFLWFMFGTLIALRDEPNPALAKGVCGITFSGVNPPDGLQPALERHINAADRGRVW